MSTALDAPDGITMTARYPGTCQGCAEQFPAGANIQFYGQGEAYHYDCRPVASSAPDKQSGYIFCDTETTGLSETKHGITQIAAIATSNNLLYQSTFQTYVLPADGIIFDKAASDITGQTREKLISMNAPSEMEAFMAFVRWCKQFPDYRFAGFNCPFDLKMLYELAKRCGFNERLWWVPPYDVMVEAKRLLRGITVNQRLTTVAAHFGLPTGSAHNALVDLLLTVGSARKLRKMAK